MSCPEFRRCSPKSQPKTRSFKIPDCLSLLLDGLFRIKLLKKAINFPCFLRTGFMGLRAKDLKIPRDVKGRPKNWRKKTYPTTGGGRGMFLGTLSPIMWTQCWGKKPTWKPLFPLHQIDSPGLAISMTEIMSPTSKLSSSRAWNADLETAQANFLRGTNLRDVSSNAVRCGNRGGIDGPAFFAGH